MYSLALIALAFISYTISVARLTAFNLVLISVIVLHIVHANLLRSLTPLFGVEEYKGIILYLWYLPFGITDILMVKACYLIIDRYGLLKDRASQAILLMFLLLAFLQFSRLLIRELGIDWGGAIYKNGVVTTNSFITILACLMALRAVLVRTGQAIMPKKECVK